MFSNLGDPLKGNPVTLDRKNPRAGFRGGNVNSKEEEGKSRRTPVHLDLEKGNQMQAHLITCLSR